MTELNERRVYEKGSVKRRKQKKKAIYVNKKYKNNNE
jgi:ribosomal protein S21